MALRTTAAQRNRLRNVRGYSPTQWVLGANPTLPAELDDEDFRRQVAMNDESVSQLDSELDRLRVQLGLLASRLELAQREVDLAPLATLQSAKARKCGLVSQGCKLPRTIGIARVHERYEAPRR